MNSACAFLHSQIVLAIISNTYMPIQITTNSSSETATTQETVYAGPEGSVNICTFA